MTTEEMWSELTAAGPGEDRAVGIGEIHFTGIGEGPLLETPDATPS